MKIFLEMEKAPTEFFCRIGNKADLTIENMDHRKNFTQNKNRIGENLFYAKNPTRKIYCF
jgi:hypothetical protein